MGFDFFVEVYLRVSDQAVIHVVTSLGTVRRVLIHYKEISKNNKAIGFAYIDFESQDVVQQILDEHNRVPILQPNGKPYTLGFAPPDPELNDTQRDTLHIQFLEDGVDRARELLSPHAQFIKSVKRCALVLPTR